MAAFLVMFQLDAENSYKKFARKTLMKFTPGVQQLRNVGLSAGTTEVPVYIVQCDLLLNSTRLDQVKH